MRAGLTVAGRNTERLNRATAGIDGDVHGHVLDAADAQVAARIAPIHHLVITLAGKGGAGPLADLSLDGLRHAFEEKYWPTVTALQASLAHLSENASITLVGAVTARAALPGTVGIGSLNAAVEGIVRDTWTRPGGADSQPRNDPRSSSRLPIPCPPSA